MVLLDLFFTSSGLFTQPRDGVNAAQLGHERGSWRFPAAAERNCRE
jgi:hypothetical protein